MSKQMKYTSFSDQVGSDILKLLASEQHSEFKPIYDEIGVLDQEYREVFKRQATGFDGETLSIEYALASLLFRAQSDSDSKMKHKAAQFKNMVTLLSNTPLGRPILLFWVHMLYPAAVVVVEQMYYQNQFFDRIFQLPVEERSSMSKEKREDWVVPIEKMDKLLEFTYNLYYHEMQEGASAS